MEKNFAQNQAIISRRKKGKTAFLQRLFNILWSAGLKRKKGEQDVIPFYYSIRDAQISLGHFALDFFTEFVKCYCSYKQRNKELLSSNIKFKQLEAIINDTNVKLSMYSFDEIRMYKKPTLKTQDNLTQNKA